MTTHYTRTAIDDMDKVQRLKLINAVTGIKPANLIGSRSNDAISNVAIFSSVVHLGSNPPLLGFIMRPTADVPRHTYNNIMENGYYTINHIHPAFAKNAHYTSAKFDREISEFERCGLTEEFIDGFSAPFVKESGFKMGMRFCKAIDIALNGTVLIIGEIEHLLLPTKVAQAEDVDLEITDSVGISGLNTYYEFTKMARYPYARVNEVPRFDK